MNLENCRIFHLQFDKTEQVKDIYFLRQLSHDEAERKVSTAHALGVLDDMYRTRLSSSHLYFLRNLKVACGWIWSVFLRRKLDLGHVFA
jgi:hypothetical protein